MYGGAPRPIRSFVVQPTLTCRRDGLLVPRALSSPTEGIRASVWKRHPRPLPARERPYVLEHRTCPVGPREWRRTTAPGDCTRSARASTSRADITLQLSRSGVERAMQRVLFSCLASRVTAVLRRMTSTFSRNLGIKVALSCAHS